MTGPGATTRLAHFRIDARIASGGMGDVYKGFDLSLKRPVAIKTIRPELAKDQGFLVRFAREATAQANVVHPNVVQVYFIGEDQGVWFIAMQVVDGGSLQRFVDEQRRMSWQDAARHMGGVAAGMAEAARLGIVHRDIKPSNILLDKAGRAHVADFGLAKARGDTDVASPVLQADRTLSDAELSAVTQVGAISGTPGYVAPEQLDGRALDERADVYALGATFFHLLGGRPPVEARSLLDALALYKGGARAPVLRSLAPEVPKGFAAVIDRCLAPEPADRIGSFAELERAIARASPQPIVPAGVFVRALTWAMDVGPFIALLAFTVFASNMGSPAVVAPIAAFLAAGAAAAATTGGTPGLWLMRLRLRTKDDGDVSFARGMARFIVQHGWFVPIALFTSFVYSSVPYAEPLGIVGVLWLAIVLLGSIGAAFGSRRALHDVVTGTRVLVDVGMN